MNSQLQQHFAWRGGTARHWLGAEAVGGTVCRVLTEGGIEADGAISGAVVPAVEVAIEEGDAAALGLAGAPAGAEVLGGTAAVAAACCCSAEPEVVDGRGGGEAFSFFADIAGEALGLALRLRCATAQAIFWYSFRYGTWSSNLTSMNRR